MVGSGERVKMDEPDPDAAIGMPLTAEDVPRISGLLSASPRRPSEYAAANIYLYRCRHAYRLIDGPSPFLIGRTYDGVRHVMPLAALDADRAEVLLGHAPCLFPLGEAEAKMLAATGRFRIDDRPDDADYLYETAALSRLDGAKAKRAQAALFARAAPTISPFDPAAAHAVLRRWIAEAGRGPDHADAHECAEAIDAHAMLGLDGVIVRVDGAAIAFLLAGRSRDGVRTVHFAKGARDPAGVYPWMFAAFAATCGARMLNFEQDLGIAGLARAKRALAPVARLRKYRLSRA
jgi:hypothetical protein